MGNEDPWFDLIFLAILLLLLAGLVFIAVKAASLILRRLRRNR